MQISLFLACLASLSLAYAHPGHSDILNRRQLNALARRQNDLVGCRSSLKERHVSRMEQVDAKRSEILSRFFHKTGNKKNTQKCSGKNATTTLKGLDLSTSTVPADAVTSLPTGSFPMGGSGVPSGSMGGGGGSGPGAGTGAAGGTTASATATAQASVLTSFPTTTISATPASETTQASDGACALSPEQEEGPYYIHGESIRENLIEDQTGIPFYAEFALIDTTTCAPLSSAVIDVWSCNSTGEYAGFVSTDSKTYNTSEYNGEIAHVGDSNDIGSVISDNLTFLRGQQLTDTSGIAKFTTLVPGWYSGRAAHIHIRVHLGGEVTSNGTYIGGNLTHTGQSFFGEDFYSQVANVYPYTLNTVSRTTNDVDRPWTQQNGTHTAWNLYYVVDGDVSQGIIGYLNLAVDSTATSQDGL